jgi:hypothetical protein
MPRFCILRRWWGCGRARKKIVRENLVICGVVERVSCFFRFGSFCLSWTFSSEWSKCSRRTRTLWGQRLSGIPVLECIFWRGTVVGVTAAVRSQKDILDILCYQCLCTIPSTLPSHSRFSLKSISYATKSHYRRRCILALFNFSSPPDFSLTL